MLHTQRRASRKKSGVYAQTLRPSRSTESTADCTCNSGGLLTGATANLVAGQAADQRADAAADGTLRRGGLNCHVAYGKDCADPDCLHGLRLLRRVRVR